MAEVPFDTCDSCGEDYDLDAKHDAMVIYLDGTNRYHHVLAHCPHCGTVLHIFVTPDTVMYILQEYHLRMTLNVDPDEDITELRDSLDDEQASDDEPPHWMLRELYDDLREFGGES